MRAVQAVRLGAVWGGFAIALMISGCRPSNSLESCSNGVLCPEGLVCAADQMVCIDHCGDGVVNEELGELCDDGNVRPGDSCASDCSRCGEAWQRMPADPSWHVASLWGTGPDDVFAVGAIGPAIDLTGVADRSRWTPHDELTAPAYRGAVFHYDGHRWSVVAEGMPPLYGVWATEDGQDRQVFAVGAEGTIGHYDGDTWSEMASGVDRTLTGVWGSSASDVFAVGLAGTLLHHDGQSWTPVELPGGESRDLYTVFGLEPDPAIIGSSVEVLAGGATGAMWRYRGDVQDPSWEAKILPGGATLDEITEIWGARDPDEPGRIDVLALAARRKALYYDGNDIGQWTLEYEADASYTPNFQGAWGSARNDVFAIELGGVVAWRGSSFRALDTAFEGHNLLGIWGSSAEDVFAGGINGTIVHNARHQLTDLGSKLRDNDQFMRGLWVVDSGVSDHPEAREEAKRRAEGVSDHIYSVGDGGRIIYYDGTSWSPMESGIDTRLYSIWGASNGELYAVGREGTVLHHSGEDPAQEPQWTLVASGAPAGEPLFGVWGRDTGTGHEVYAVGAGGAIVHRDDTGTWQTMDSGTAVDLRAVWVREGDGRAFVVGEAGTVLSREPGSSSWDRMSVIGPPVLLRDVWGTGSGDVFAVGGEGVILHYDGNEAGEWVQMDSPCVIDALQAVWGTGPDNVFAVGLGINDDGPPIRSEIAHYDGHRWAKLPHVRPMDMRAVHGLESGLVVLTGRDGRSKSLQLPLW